MQIGQLGIQSNAIWIWIWVLVYVLLNWPLLTCTVIKFIDSKFVSVAEGLGYCTCPSTQVVIVRVSVGQQGVGRCHAAHACRGPE